MLGRSYSWLDQRLRAGQLVLPGRDHGATVADAGGLSAVHPSDAPRHHRGQRPPGLVLSRGHAICPSSSNHGQLPRDGRVQRPEMIAPRCL